MHSDMTKEYMHMLIACSICIPFNMAQQKYNLKGDDVKTYAKKLKTI